MEHMLELPMIVRLAITEIIITLKIPALAVIKVNMIIQQIPIIPVLNFQQIVSNAIRRMTGLLLLLTMTDNIFLFTVEHTKGNGTNAWNAIRTLIIFQFLLV